MDTICAISTPAGVGGIAVIRVSGDNAIEISDSIWKGKPLIDAASHTAHLGTVLNDDGSPLDQCVATVYRGPHSFTGEDVVEIAVHGSKYVQRQLISVLIAKGARLAQPGEFTRRAFAAGKLDLAQAEAVADIIASSNRAAHRIAMSQMRGGFSQRLHELRAKLIDIAALLELELDFSEEDVEFASRRQLLDIATDVQREVRRLADSFHNASAIKDGIPVAIIGATNAGKSSLLNALVGDDRAIVSDIHGTTRDVVEDTLNIGDYTFRLMDTAGLRDTSDEIERLGIQRSNKAASTARIIILVVDITSPTLPTMPSTDASVIIVLNKSDLQPSPQLPGILDSAISLSARTGDGASDIHKTAISLSARTGDGIDALRAEMQRIAAECEGDGDILVTNARHYQALTNAYASVTRAIDGLAQQLSGDLIAMDIRETIHHLGEILGEISSQEILQTIFSRFCIGK